MPFTASVATGEIEQSYAETPGASEHAALKIPDWAIIIDSKIYLFPRSLQTCEIHPLVLCVLSSVAAIRAV